MLSSQYIWVAVKISPFSIFPIAIPGLSSINLWFSERVVEAKVPLQKLCNIAFTLCLFRQWKLFNVFTLGSRNTYHCHPSACVKSCTDFSKAAVIHVWTFCVVPFIAYDLSHGTKLTSSCLVIVVEFTSSCQKYQTSRSICFYISGLVSFFAKVTSFWLNELLVTNQAKQSSDLFG